MKPYYEDGAATLYHGDAREILPTIAPESVDLLLTDPPYGIDYKVASHHGHVGRLAGQQVSGDAEPFDPTHLLAFGRCVIFGGNYMTDVLPPSGWVIWSKVQDNRWSHGKHSTRSLAEMAWTNLHNYVAVYNCFWAGSPMHRMGDERGSQLHPTQKPVALMRWIVDRYTEPGDLVLDPYMGSGPVARACKDTGRRYIGIEIEERYCETAVRRLDQGVLDFTETSAFPDDDQTHPISLLDTNTGAPMSTTHDHPDARDAERDDTLCTEHRDGKPGAPHEWRRGRRGRTRVVMCNPQGAA